MKFISVFFAFLTLGSAHAASSNIPDKNPFASTQLSPKPSKETLSLYFSGNVTGMRESCGCALSPKGGLERRYNYLKKEGLLNAKGEDTLVLDFGNLLFKTPEIQQGAEAEAFANAQKLIEATNLFNFTAVNFGAMDRSLGSTQLSKLWAKSRFPWLSTNITPPGRFAATFKKRIPVKLKTGDLAVFGLSSLDEKLKSEGWVTSSPAEALLKELSDLPSATFPVVLSDLELSELVALAQQIKRPILFLGSRETGGWDRPMEVGQALLLHLRQQGQEWGLIKFSPHNLSAQGWYNPQDTQALAARWDTLVAEAKAIRGLASSEQKDIELKDLEVKLTELAKLAPKKNDYTYLFETTEMNASYAGKNEATRFMK